MYFHFELILAGIILLTAMALGGITLWRKRRNDLKEEQSDKAKENDIE